MKKFFCALHFFICVALVFASGCAKTPNKEVLIYSDYPIYDTIENAKSAANVIIEGIIVSSEEVMLDSTEPLTEEQIEDPKMNPGGETDGLNLPYTIYVVEIQKVYKGNIIEGNTIEFKRLGGTVGNIHYTEEDAMEIEVGSTYIMFLETYSNSPASLINQVQGMYEYKENKITGNNKNKITLDLKDLG